MASMNTLSRRRFLGQVAAAAGAASLPRSLAAAGASQGRKPNVLFFMSDDMCCEVNCFGSWYGAKTPTIDALAATGVRFDRNYCQFPICNPSRTSLLTNRRPTTTRVLGNRQNFRPDHPDWVSLPQLFLKNGYATLRTGKIFHDIYDDAQAWSVGGGAPLVDGGAGGKAMEISRPPDADLVPKASDSLKIVDQARRHEPDYKLADHATAYVLPALAQDNDRAGHSDRLIVLDGDGEGHPDYATATTAIQYLRDHKDGPFFIGCGFVKPHSPPCAPRRFLDLWDPQKIQLPPNFAHWPTVPAGFPSAAIRRNNADLFIGRGASEAEARETIRMYLASIAFADWNMGRVLAELDRLGLRDNTIVVFVADHGYQLGENGKWSKAGSLFELGTRVPLIISAPGVAGNGGVCTRTVESLDLFSTLAELCGLPLPAGGEGMSLAPLLNDPKAPWDRPAYSVWSEDSKTLHGVAVRTERWRYVEYGPQGSHGALLFDEQGDPRELKNLAYEPTHAEIVARLSPLVRGYAAGLG